jgi:hypothetical protein
MQAVRRLKSLKNNLNACNISDLRKLVYVSVKCKDLFV